MKMLRYEILQDESPESPREWDNLGTIVSWHRRYSIGEVANPKAAPKEYKEGLEKGTVILPVYMYNHSGIVLNTTGFSCPWDSGQLGYIYAEPEKIKECMGWKTITKKRREKVEKMLRGEVETYNQYQSGDVWGYRILDGEEEVESVWGFYGEEYCEVEAKSAMGHWEEKAKKVDATLCS